MAYRDAIDEWAFRDPSVWTSPEFVQRCAGLPVIFEHPDGRGLDSEYYRENAIGTVILPYVKGAEVWGIAKIFDADAATLMQTTHRSTSPGVTPPKGAEAISLEGGAKVLDEGLPLILDHLAVCELGVWDKDGPPEGIRLDSIGKGAEVADQTLEELQAELAKTKRRADSAEAERDDAKSNLDKAKKDAEEAEKEREDKAKRDADEEAAQEAEAREEREKADAKVADRKKRHDAGKHDGKHNDCALCDAAEAEEAERKDGAPVETVNANREEAIKDSQTRIQRLESELAAMRAAQAPLSHDERNAVAAAFHRADSVYQMLGEQTPQIMPGERPSAYRRRLADGLRKHTKSFKTETIHDSVSGAAFDIIEDRIYAEALDEAKNPSRNDAAFVLREIVTHPNGKTRRDFYGDSRVAWAPFMPPVGVRITKFNKPGAQ